MQIPETDTQTLVKALRILANDIQSEDGIANSVISEGADRIEKLLELVDGAYDFVEIYGASKWREDWLASATKYGAGPEI